jgi:hypothetical protein
MAIARDTTAANIKPLGAPDVATIRRRTCGATVAAGELVHLSSDGKVDPCDASSITLASVDGVAVQGGGDGDVIDVVTAGPVQCITGGTPGALVYASDTAGEPAETAGTKVSVAGYVESATVLYVRPFQTVFS